MALTIENLKGQTVGACVSGGLDSRTIANAFLERAADCNRAEDDQRHKQPEAPSSGRLHGDGSGGREVEHQEQEGWQPLANQNRCSVSDHLGQIRRQQQPDGEPQ